MQSLRCFLVVSAFAMLSLAYIAETQDPPPTPTIPSNADVYPALNGWAQRLNRIENLNLTSLINAVIGILQFLPCLATTTLVNATQLHYYKAVAELQTSSKNSLALPEQTKEKISMYMKSPQFREIHEFLWKEGSHWNELIELLYTFGMNDAYPGHTNIYVYFRELYDGFNATELDLPTAPGGNAVRRKRSIIPIIKSSSSPQMELLLESLLAEIQACGLLDLLKIIQYLIDSKLVDWAELLRFTLIKVNSDPGVHVIWAKIYEHEKGADFRKFRSLPSMKELILHWDKEIKSIPILKLLVSLLSDLTGIDFAGADINVAGNLISIVEYLVWRTPFPALH